MFISQYVSRIIQIVFVAMQSNGSKELICMPYISISRFCRVRTIYIAKLSALIGYFRVVNLIETVPS